MDTGRLDMHVWELDWIENKNDIWLAVPSGHLLSELHWHLASYGGIDTVQIRFKLYNARRAEMEQLKRTWPIVLYSSPFSFAQRSGGLLREIESSYRIAHIRGQIQRPQRVD